MEKHNCYALTEADLTHCPQIKMLGRRYLTDASTHPLPLHRNEGIEICILLKGRFEWTIEDHCYQLYPNDCTFTLPWQRHGGTNDILDTGELVWIIISPEKYERNGNLKLGKWSKLPLRIQQEIGQQLCNAPQPHLTADNYLKQVFNELSAEVRLHEQAQRWRIDRLLDELLYYLFQQLRRGERIRKNVFDIERLKKKIAADIKREWTLNDLAAITGYGKTMMNGLMRQQTGYSPMEMLQHMRIDKAREQLRNTTLTITEISLQCGFKSSQHFATVFKKIVGKTPITWRKHNYK